MTKRSREFLDGSDSSFVRKLLVEKTEKPEIHSLPKSGLIAQLESFLPRLSDANKRLDTICDKKTSTDSKIDEHCITVGDVDGRHVEMDVFVDNSLGKLVPSAQSQDPPNITVIDSDENEQTHNLQSDRCAASEKSSDTGGDESEQRLEKDAPTYAP